MFLAYTKKMFASSYPTNGVLERNWASQAAEPTRTSSSTSSLASTLPVPASLWLISSAYYPWMGKGRLEAFSDGVIAILITIMVLELKTPQGFDLSALRPMIPALLAYVLSFVVLGIYWNNHHHMFHATDRINGKVMCANLHLLFWLSLLPFATGWMGENHFAALPTAAYGTDLFLAAIAYWILENTIIAEHGPHSRLAAALGGSDGKAKFS